MDENLHLIKLNIKKTWIFLHFFFWFFEVVKTTKIDCSNFHKIRKKQQISYNRCSTVQNIDFSFVLYFFFAISLHVCCTYIHTHTFVYPDSPYDCPGFSLCIFDLISRDLSSNKEKLTMQKKKLFQMIWIVCLNEFVHFLFLLFSK